MERFSIIVPVYNRPDEVSELLASLAAQTFADYELIIVEDGSSLPCEQVVEAYKDRLPVRYFTKPNSGPGQTRNYGAERAKGEYLLFWDSDILVPDGYFEALNAFLQANPVDAFGGPDKAHESFTDVQKAINYSMTSFFTTGGIRGGKKKLDRFYPRSFNMGIRREVFNALHGFRAMRFGEDVDFSYRIVEAGYSTALVPDAFVYHKRRTDFRKFFRQVHNSGRARINLAILHPGTLRPVHTLPALFTICVIPFFPLMPLYALLVCIDAAVRNSSLHIGLLAVVASFTQLIGYGTGFIAAAFRRYILRKDNKDAFTATFYK